MAQPFFNVGVAPANPTAADQLVATLGQFGRIFLTGRGSVTNLGSSIEVVFYESNCSINAGVPSESTLPMTGGSWTDANTFAGDLNRTTGPGFATPFIPSQVVTAKVGKLTIYFTDANNGTFYYTIDGASGAKNITRQIF